MATIEFLFRLSNLLSGRRGPMTHWTSRHAIELADGRSVSHKEFLSWQPQYQQALMDDLAEKSAMSIEAAAVAATRCLANSGERALAARELGDCVYAAVKSRRPHKANTREEIRKNLLSARHARQALEEATRRARKATVRLREDRVLEQGHVLTSRQWLDVLRQDGTRLVVRGLVLTAAGFKYDRVIFAVEGEAVIQYGATNWHLR